MRPIVRGDWPLDKLGRHESYTDYQRARGELIRRLGGYCSYCEMQLDSGLHVEHVQPKKEQGTQCVDSSKNSDWDNFLLACVNCNATKSNKSVNDCLLPDRDDTFVALCYQANGIVMVASDQLPSVQIKAKNLIALVGLDKTPSNDSKMSDRRWHARSDAWSKAVHAKKTLETSNSDEMLGIVVMLATASGYWSIWMTVFASNPDVLQALLNTEKFPGTNQKFFNS